MRAPRFAEIDRFVADPDLDAPRFASPDRLHAEHAIGDARAEARERRALVTRAVLEGPRDETAILALRFACARTSGHAGPGSITSDAMSYRTIALASCLLMVVCGGAPPPPAEAPRAPVEGSAAAAPPDTSKKPDDPETKPSTMDPTGPAPAAPPSGTTTPAQGGEGKGKNVGQAVVETRPLGGKLTQDDIRRILEQNGDVFGDCYTLGAGGKSKSFKGVVTVKATIGPKGAINQVDVTKSTANNAKVDTCVRDSFKKIKFPPPHDGATTVITFPISFNGVEQVQ